MNRVTLVAPLAGWCLPLEEVPDPVFAQRMAGDGMAIDPAAGVLRAPCDGEIVPMKDARHAVTVRTDSGIEVLAHVGIDTVELKGAGFRLLAAPGQRVRAGDALIEFDLDLLARRARSLVTPVVVASGGTIERRFAGGPIAAGDFLMEVVAAASAQVDAGAMREEVRAFIVPFDHGLHVRPAAQVAAALRPYAAQVTLLAQGRSANARSTVAMMALGVRCGDPIEARAAGADAPAALAALETLFEKPAPKIAAAPAEARPHRARLEGAIASRGLALGPCVPWSQPEIAVAERGAGEASESAALAQALAAVVAELERQRDAARGDGQALLAAHAELAQDPDLRARAAARLAGGHSAGSAWRHATRATAQMLLALDDERMRERAADLRDLENQVLQVLSGKPASATREFPRRHRDRGGDPALADDDARARRRRRGVHRARRTYLAHGDPRRLRGAPGAGRGRRGGPRNRRGHAPGARRRARLARRRSARRAVERGRARAGAARSGARGRSRRGPRACLDPRRRAHRREREPRRVRRSSQRARPGRRRLRPAAHRIPVPRPARAARRRRAGRRIPGASPRRSADAR